MAVTLKFENQVHKYPDIYAVGTITRETTYGGTYTITLRSDDEKYVNEHGEFRHKFALRIVFYAKGDDAVGWYQNGEDKKYSIFIPAGTIGKGYVSGVYYGNFSFNDEKLCRGDIQPKFYIKCQAMIEGEADGGCGIGGVQTGTSSFEDLEWKHRNENPNMNTEILSDPYTPPSNAVLRIIERSTRKISASITWDYGSVFGGSLYVNTGYASINGNVQTFTKGQVREWDNLTHGTGHELKATVYDGRTSVPCIIEGYNIESYPNIDISDSVTTVIVPSSKTTVYTRKLGCNAVLQSDGPTIALALFEPTIDGVVTTSSVISTRGVKFYKKSDNSNISTIQCIYNGADYGGSGARRTYKITELIPGEVYCIEFVTTDWYNDVTSKLEVEMPYPLTRIFNGKFKYAIPYIYHNGKWCKAYGYIFTNAWKMNSYKTITDARKENNS